MHWQRTHTHMNTQAQLAVEVCLTSTVQKPHLQAAPLYYKWNAKQYEQVAHLNSPPDRAAQKIKLKISAKHEVVPAAALPSLLFIIRVSCSLWTFLCLQFLTDKFSQLFFLVQVIFFTSMHIILSVIICLTVRLKNNKMKFKAKNFNCWLCLCKQLYLHQLHFQVSVVFFSYEKKEKKYW